MSLRGSRRTASGRSERDLGIEVESYEYGSRAGVWRILDLFEKRNFLHRLSRHGAGTESARDRGVGEIRCRVPPADGSGSITMRFPKKRAGHIARAVEITRRLTGQTLRGWYCRYAPSANTRRLLVEHGGFLYDGDSYADDLPYWVPVGDVEQLVVPYSLDTNDMKFAAPAAWVGDDFFVHLRDSVDSFVEEGEARRRCSRSACIKD